MLFALVNPPWDFAGSVYFGCKEPHFPLELGYSKALLDGCGHSAVIVDAHAEALSPHGVRQALAALAPDFIVVTTAPGYLFWRCAQPELRVPMALLRALAGLPALKVAVGPHCSVTPTAALEKLGADAVVMGEPETVLPELALKEGRLGEVASICYRSPSGPRVQGRPRATDMSVLPALKWPQERIAMHSHHHHRFGARPWGPGAEVESSRGCPYSCTFCAKREFRAGYRRRPLPTVLKEIDWLAANGAEYVYFVDEIFMPDRRLLEALSARRLKFGIQTRIDLWSPGMLALLGAAGCCSIEAGVESVTEHGRSLLGKRCSVTTAGLAAALMNAKKHVPFVQATLLEAHADDPALVEAWRALLMEAGVWVNRPVPLFPYPGSEEYSRRWGEPDALAWERAHEHYVAMNSSFSDLQEARPVPIRELERI